MDTQEQGLKKDHHDQNCEGQEAQLSPRDRAMRRVS